MKRPTATLLLMAALAAGSLSLCLAQEPAAPPAAGAPGADAPKQKKMTLWDYWKTGGWCMYPILLLSGIASGLAVYAWLAMRQQKMTQDHLVPQLQDAVGKLDFATASSVCVGQPGVLTNILNAGLMRITPAAGIRVEALERGMEEMAIEENTAGLKPITGISVCASIAPMFGLLGTVDGMIKAFNKIGLGKMGDPEALAGDIGEAMITTWFGLVVGIPTMFLYFWLKSDYQARMAKIARLLGNVTHRLQETLKLVESGELVVEATAPGTAPAMPAPAPAPAAPPA